MIDRRNFLGSSRRTEAANRTSSADPSPPVRIGPSAIEGTGVFAARPLVARRKIGELVGVVRVLPEARRLIENQPRIYLIEFTRRLALDCSESGPFRHLNHSCRPNCFLRVYRRRVEVYTLRNIPAGDELTVDYGMTPHRGGMSCRCGSPGCRGRL